MVLGVLGVTEFICDVLMSGPIFDKSKMAAIGHVENKLFKGLAYSAMWYMVLGILGVMEFIFDDF